MIIPDSIPEKSIFKPEEVARLFCVPRKTVYSWVHIGKIRAVRIGERIIRIQREALLEFIAAKGRGFVCSGEKAVLNRMILALRGRISGLVRGKVKTSTSMKLIGCTVDQFRAHIEKQFLPGMTWENYGRNGWTIDHVIPCAQFDLSIPDSQKICFNYTNLQPLWHSDNIKKGKKYTRRNIRKVIRISHALS